MVARGNNAIERAALRAAKLAGLETGGFSSDANLCMEWGLTHLVDEISDQKLAHKFVDELLGPCDTSVSFMPAEQILQHESGAMYATAIVTGAKCDGFASMFAKTGPLYRDSAVLNSTMCPDRHALLFSLEYCRRVSDGLNVEMGIIDSLSQSKGVHTLYVIGTSDDSVVEQRFVDLFRVIFANTE